MNKAEKALDMADGLKKLIGQMIPESKNLDLKRVLKQIDADLMDIKHKLTLAIDLTEKEV